ncbi:hypothetical protein HDF26_002970 [Pedobacter cryoconitis]|uniref:YhcG PDDEXK nuclease domain-containing protein n=1 Tax=Pedobacter cryoconitis TaxID=188932 RepID=A0A7W8ZHX7_9SPHI|nr:PDDEXK nuclease domain-containing protein [Pedobacter cryoconitis]MBB5634364.1 hypothetical protein [Pedobacter cryoconitis]MBB6272513.1 hypothetical protein [Pedobacter cryoconitis]
MHTIESGWNTHTLQRNITSQYIGRVLDTSKQEIPRAQQLIKDPYIFEFLGLPMETKISENKIETALINHLQQFLMELGKGFAFIPEQVKMGSSPKVSIDCFIMPGTELLKQPVLQTTALKMKPPRIPFENLPFKLPIINKCFSTNVSYSR